MKKEFRASALREQVPAAGGAAARRAARVPPARRQGPPAGPRAGVPRPRDGWSSGESGTHVLRTLRDMNRYQNTFVHF